MRESSVDWRQVERIYLDHAASSPLRPEAAAAMAQAASVPGNPSSTHGSGRAARRLLEEARESLAADLGAQPSEVIFTSGGTESDNLAILGASGARADGVRRTVISAVEHVAVRAAALSIPGSVEIAVDAGGILRLDRLQAELALPTALVSVLAVNNETGTRQPVEQVVEIARSAGALVHTDAIQAFGHLPLDFTGLGVDLMTVSAHKLGGPVGVGALVLRRGVRLQPMSYGGGQEAELRSGTVPVALAAGFAAAARIAVATLEREAERLMGLRDWLSRQVLAQIPNSRVNGAAGSPAIVNFGFRDLHADDLLLILDRAGFDCSTGAACQAGVHQPSRVLQAMGADPAEAISALRVSFGSGTTRRDVERLAAVLPAAVATAQAAHARVG